MEQVLEKPEVIIEIPRKPQKTLPEITWTHKGVPHILSSIPIDAKSIIDVGCGRGIIGALARIYRNPTKVVGVDVFTPYLDSCQKMGFYDKLVKWNLNHVPLPFRDKEFDVATCVEVIEHLSKDSGACLISELERIANTVIITTPNVMFTQDAFDGNPFQEHVSCWSAAEFHRLGYKVYGIGDLNLFGRHVKYLSFLFSRFSYKFPVLYETLLACKTLT
ncbi:MAG: methyltransferase domain-containing protein [Candidatus Bathyarchaeia archaeon]